MTLACVETNKVISLTYSILDDKDTILEQSDLPVTYLHGGKSDLFKKIEDELNGKVLGDKISVTLEPEEGFGSYDPGLTFTDDVHNVPEELRYVGAELEAQNADGEVLKFMVSNIREGKLTVDANHPMAGKTVTFKVKITGIRDATADEVKSGHVVSDHSHPLQ